MPKVSIVMSVFNGAQFLEATLQSLVQQTYKDFELIIIDNRSTDETPSIIKKYLGAFSHIIYHTTEIDMSYPEGLNKGFSLATGEYWTKADCDNLYCPNALERMVMELDANPTVDFVYFDMELINDKDELIGYAKARPIAELAYVNFIGCCLLYRASLAKRVGEYHDDMRLVEDYDYWLRCNEIGNLQPINECHFRYRVHNDSLSYKYEKEVIRKSIKLQKKYYYQYINTRRKAALFYAYIRARDIYNPFRQFYLFLILFYSPSVFFEVVYKRRIPAIK